MEEEILEQTGEIDARTRGIALVVVGLSWLWAIVTIGRFMFSMLGTLPPGATRPSVADFMKMMGPWIVTATILIPLGVAATMNWLRAHGQRVQSSVDSSRSALRTFGNHLYAALVSPLAELSARLGWGVLVVIGLILTYALCYNIWASFAYPFYLDYLHYTKDEVAFASKIFGIIMTIVGVSVGGLLFVRIGRFPTVLIGATLPILGNFLYAGLSPSAGVPRISTCHVVAHLLRLDAAGDLVRQRRADDAAADGHFGGEYLDRHRRRRIRRLCLGYRQQALFGGAICAAVVADLPGRVARPRHRWRGV